MGLLEVDIYTWCALAGIIVTLITSFVTTSNASSETKTIVNLFLAALGGVIVTVSTNTGDLRVGELIAGGLTTWLTSVVAYRHLSQPLQIDQRIHKATPNLGIGSKNSATLG